MPRPSLRALRAFAAVCKAGAVAPAARTLCVSPSAVSHLLRELELTLNVALFAGRGPGGPLSEQGERLRAGIGNAFEVIDAAVSELGRRVGEVRITTLSTFSGLWLVPRLERLRAAQPDIRLLIATDTRSANLAAEPFDCAIRNGHGGWPGVEAMLLFRERLVPVVNARLVGEEASSGAIARLPRIAARVRPKDWPLVLDALGLPPGPSPALVLETRQLAVQAALAGLGVAVIDHHLVMDLLTSGMLSLAVPGWPGVELSDGFFFIARVDRLRDPHVRGLRDWLADEALATAS
jgi:LysR family glycine cleavage system transcriptional activator